MFKYLGKFIWKKNLQSSSLICRSPTKAIWRVFLKSLSKFATCILIEVCQIVATHREIHFILLWSRSRTRPLICYTSTLEDSKYIHPYTQKIKLHAITWLSFSKLPSRIQATQKEIKDTYPKKICHMPTRHVKKEREKMHTQRRYATCPQGMSKKWKKMHPRRYATCPQGMTREREREDETRKR